MKKLTKEEFIDKCNGIHGDKYDYSLVEYRRNDIKIKIICKKCNCIFEQLPNGHTSRKQGCMSCSGSKKLTTEVFIKKSELIHGDKFDYSLVNYITSHKKVKIICKKCNHIFEQKPNDHLNGIGCVNCKNINNRSTTEKFINKSKEIHNNKFDYSLVNYIDNKTKIKIICHYHGIFEQLPMSHIKGIGCFECSKINKLVEKEEVINRFIKIHGDRYDYSLVIYIGMNKKVKIICKEHGTFFQTPVSHLNKNGCSKCNSTKGETLISNILVSKFINFEVQKRFNNCIDKITLPFDFYLPDYNTCIEYDGIQHFIPIEYFGGEKTLIGQQLRDNIKTEYCKENEIKLIRIRYDDNIEERLLQELDLLKNPHYN